MPLFLVGTRFQAVMSLSILRARDISKYRLVIFTNGPSGDPMSDVAFRSIADGATSVRIVDRTMRPLAFQAVLLALAARQLAVDRTILTAGIGTLQIMAVFRLLPFLRCLTFDEGGYNISSDSPFHQPEKRSRLRNLLFPGGIVAYARRRTAIHYTAFDPALNVFSQKAQRIPVSWTELLSADDLNQLPDTISSLFVLPCMRDLRLSDTTRAAILEAAAGCDVAIRHPREQDIDLPNAVSLASPVEAVIAHYSERDTVTVKHFRSTVGHTMSHWPNVNIVDSDKIAV